MDDEYFRLTLTSKEDNKLNPDRQQPFQKTLKSLQRPEAKGLSSSFFEGVTESYRETSEGILIPGLLRSADGSRLDKVAKRITIGLFFYATGRRLPDKYSVIALQVGRIADLNFEQQEAALAVISHLISKEPYLEIGNAFTCWSHFHPNDWARSMWVLKFYDSIEYKCSTSIPIQ